MAFHEKSLIKFPTKRVFPIFHILRVNRIALFWYNRLTTRGMHSGTTKEMTT